MKLEFKTTLVVGPGQTLPPGSVVDIDDEELARSLIESGKAKPAVEDEDNNPSENENAAKAAEIAEAEAQLAALTQAAEEAIAKAAAETDAKTKKVLEAEAANAKAAVDEARTKLEQVKA